MNELGKRVETVLSFRHGDFEGSNRSKLTGEAARLAASQVLSMQEYYEMDLLPHGRLQGELLRKALGEFAVDVCLCSPTRRTRSMAEAVFRDRQLPGGLVLVEGLRERDRGIFRYMPDEIAKNDPRYPSGEPVLSRHFPEGQTLVDVIEQLKPVLQLADKLAPGGCVAFSTHAENMLAQRGMSCLGAMTEERFDQPLVPNQPESIRALRKAKWIGTAQTDIYTRRSPIDGTLSPCMTHFRSFGVDPLFDTGWMEIVR